jgi:hypothetical protein
MNICVYTYMDVIIRHFSEPLKNRYIHCGNELVCMFVSRKGWAKIHILVTRNLFSKIKIFPSKPDILKTTISH